MNKHGSGDGKKTEEMTFDVAVIGGGNAALVSAITAADNGCKVVLLEAAPKSDRGGNTKYTRDIRYAHDEDRFTRGVYEDDEFLEDLRGVSGNSLDEDMARFVITESRKIPDWMLSHGVIFKKDIRGTLSLGRTNLFFLGGGKSLINKYYEVAEKIGIKILYNSQVTEIITDKNRATAIHSVSPDNEVTISFKSLIVASGGFEGNLEKLSEVWGETANNFIIRGTVYNKGIPLFLMIKHGAEVIGSERGGHMVAVDARAPKFDGGIITRLDAIPMGVAINTNGERFYNEGEDLWPKRYASWGHIIADQPSQIAYVIVDSKADGMYLPGPFKPYVSDTLEGLLNQLDVPSRESLATVEEFNRKVVPGKFDRSVLDGCHTEGLEINKSNWARKIEIPPFYAYPMRPGLTFTYMGLKVNKEARVLKKDGPFANVFAAGEIMSGNVLVRGYLAGFGLTIGTTFGRLAGLGASSQS